MTPIFLTTINIPMSKTYRDHRKKETFFKSFDGYFIRMLWMAFNILSGAKITNETLIPIYKKIVFRRLPDIAHPIQKLHQNSFYANHLQNPRSGPGKMWRSQRHLYVKYEHGESEGIRDNFFWFATTIRDIVMSGSLAKLTIQIIVASELKRCK